MNWQQIVRGSFGSHVPDDDVVEELAQHAQALYEASRADGADADEASARVKEQIAAWTAEASALRRAAKRLPAIAPPSSQGSALTGIAQDVTYAARLLARRPASGLVAILTMALGIGATTVLFSVAWGVLFKPLPWTGADRLVRLTETREGSTRRLPDIITNGTYLSWREAPSTIEGIAGWGSDAVTIGGAGDPERLRIAEVTATLFPLLNVWPSIGVPFDESPAHERSIVLSHGLWQQRFGGRADAIGRSIRLDGQAYTVSAVMPAGFYFPDRETRAWIPMRVPPVVGPGEGRAISIFSAVARLKPGVTPRQAAEEGTARGRSAPDPGLTATALFGSRGPVTIAATPMLDAITKDVRPALLIFLAAVGLLLATATANVASVQLARATTRRREIAIRAALGAGGVRLTRQLLVENLLLGLGGGVVGVAGAFWLHRMLPTLLPADFPRASEISLDPAVLAFAAVVSILASVGCGLLPVLHARGVNLVGSLSEDSLAPAGGGTRTRTARARTLIMAGQVAVAAILLIGASLLVRSFSAMLHVDRGYDATNVLTARVPMPPPAYDDTRRAEVLGAMVERLRGTPGVMGAAFTSILPLSGSDMLLAFTLPPKDAGGQPVPANAALRVVSAGYFGAMGIRLSEGRLLTGQDVATALPVVVVNRTFAARYLDGRAVGARLPLALEEGRDEWQVVGVVEDVRTGGVTDPPQPEIYCHYQQRAGVGFTVPSIVVRVAGDPNAFVPQLRAIAREQDTNLALDRVTTMEQRVLGNLAAPRLYAMLLGGFAAVAVVIAAVGLFGVLSYSVAQRAREIAVRSALGARPGQIARLVLAQGLAVTAGGLAAGLLAALVLTQSMQAFIYGVEAHDTVTFVAVPLLLLAIAALACLVPVRRALALDPVQVIKSGP